MPIYPPNLRPLAAMALGFVAVVVVISALVSSPPPTGKLWREFAAASAGHDDGTMQCSTEPRISGSFLQPGLVEGWSAEQWDAEFRHLREACISEVVLQWTADSSAKTAIYPSVALDSGRSAASDVVARALAAAERAGLDVYLGLQMNDEWWRTYASDTAWLAAEARLAQRLIDELWTNYGDASSFAGWYLPFEVDNWHLGEPASWTTMASFYSAVAGHAKQVTPDLPVVISPFFNPAGGLSPAGWAEMWAAILPAAPIDAIALQDGVGVGHSTADQLAAWFEATAAAIDATGSDTELWCTTETFTPEFGSMDIGSVVQDMIAVQPYVTRYWSFSYDHYQSPQQVGPALHRTYLDYLTTGTV